MFPRTPFRQSEKRVLRRPAPVRRLAEVRLLAMSESATGISFQEESLRPEMRRKPMKSSSRVFWGLIVSYVFGYMVGSIFSPNAYWSTIIALVTYHVFVVWLVIIAEKKEGVYPPIFGVIVGHLMCLALVVAISGNSFEQFLNRPTVSNSLLAFVCSKCRLCFVTGILGEWLAPQ